jgi:hypothetical protein
MTTFSSNLDGKIYQVNVVDGGPGGGINHTNSISVSASF